MRPSKNYLLTTSEPPSSQPPSVREGAGMDTYVIIPEDLSLYNQGKRVGVVANSGLSPGQRFSPFEGTLRTGTTDSPSRTASWVKFLRRSAEAANLREILVGGQILYELCTEVGRGQELTVRSVSVNFEGALKGLLFSVPLDLSLPLFIPHRSPTLRESSTSESEGENCNSVKRRGRSLLPCSICGKAFDRPSLLKRHMRTHTGEKPHGCEVCGKGFSTSSSLNTHRRIHSGEKPHECPTCGKRFTASSNLYYHRMTHVKEKPHKCVSCGKSFPTPGDLKSHGYVHSGSWPFRCPVCKRGFSKHTNLKNHLFLHTGNKPHACNVCPKKFALACNLRAHVKTHDE